MAEKENKKKARISKAPSLIRSNGRVYIGCDLYNHRIEMSLCDHKKCRRRRKCEHYIEARSMKQEWEDIYGPSKSPLNPESSNKRKRKRKTNTSNNAPLPLKRKRKRKNKQEEETYTPTKRKRKRKAGIGITDG